MNDPVTRDTQLASLKALIENIDNTISFEKTLHKTAPKRKTSPLRYIFTIAFVITVLLTALSFVRYLRTGTFGTDDYIKSTIITTFADFFVLIAYDIHQTMLNNQNTVDVFQWAEQHQKELQEAGAMEQRSKDLLQELGLSGTESPKALKKAYQMMLHDPGVSLKEALEHFGIKGI